MVVLECGGEHGRNCPLHDRAVPYLEAACPLFLLLFCFLKGAKKFALSVSSLHRELISCALFCFSGLNMALALHRIIGARLVSGYMCSLDQLNHSRVLQLPLCRGRKFQSRSPAQSPAAASMARARWATSQRTCSLWCFVRGTEAPRESACLWRSFFPSPKKGPLEQRLRTPGRKFCRLTF